MNKKTVHTFYIGIFLYFGFGLVFDMVLPGSFLSTEEEFLPGNNCFADKKGNVFSDSVGEKSFDTEEKIVTVSKKTPDIRMLARNDTIFGVVTLVKEQSVLIEILEVFDKSNPSKKVVFGSPMAMLPVFSVANSYIKFLSDFFKVGDIVKARIDSVSNVGIELETKTAQEFGVVIAYCTACRQPMSRFEQDLKCPNCGSLEQRKLSFDYLVK